MDADAASLPTALDDAPPPFRLVVSTDLWLPRLEGDFTDAGAEVDVRAVDLHDSETSFAGALALVGDRVRVELRGFSFSTHGSSVAESATTLGGVGLAPGDRYDSSFSWWSAGAEVSYEALRVHRDGANGTDFGLFLLGSLDVQSVSRDLVNLTTGLATDAHEPVFVAEAGAGFRLGFDTRASVPLFRSIEIGGKGTVGAAVPMGDGDLGGATRIEAWFSGRVTESLSLFVGYRLVGLGLAGEEMEMTGSLQGLRAGFSYEF